MTKKIVLLLISLFVCSPTYTAGAFIRGFSKFTGIATGVAAAASSGGYYCLQQKFPDTPTLTNSEEAKAKAAEVQKLWKEKTNQEVSVFDGINGTTAVVSEIDNQGLVMGLGTPEVVVSEAQAFAKNRWIPVRETRDVISAGIFGGTVMGAACPWVYLKKRAFVIPSIAATLALAQYKLFLQRKHHGALEEATKDYDEASLREFAQTYKKHTQGTKNEILSSVGLRECPLVDDIAYVLEIRAQQKNDEKK